MATAKAQSAKLSTSVDIATGAAAPAAEAIEAGAALPPARQDTFRIADLAADFGVTARTIRFYETHGLLQPLRHGQNRIYTKQDRNKLAWILRGKRVGFSLTEIKDMLDLYDADENRMTQRAVTLSKCRERIGALQSQRADIDATLQELHGFVATLETLVSDQDQTPIGPWDEAAE